MQCRESPAPKCCTKPALTSVAVSSCSLAQVSSPCLVPESPVTSGSGARRSEGPCEQGQWQAILQQRPKHLGGQATPLFLGGEPTEIGPCSDHEWKWPFSSLQGQLRFLLPPPVVLPGPRVVWQFNADHRGDRRQTEPSGGLGQEGFINWLKPSLGKILMAQQSERRCAFPEAHRCHAQAHRAILKCTSPEAE
jgi:hypothetical protein